MSKCVSWDAYSRTAVARDALRLGVIYQMIVLRCTNDLCNSLSTIANPSQHFTCFWKSFVCYKIVKNYYCRFSLKLLLCTVNSFWKTLLLSTKYCGRYSPFGSKWRRINFDLVFGNTLWNKVTGKTLKGFDFVLKNHKKQSLLYFMSH